MASALSEEEFHRLQMQLIELRTAKYELESVNKKQERELQSLKELSEVTEKELEKAQKTISKSKKAKEVDILIRETDTLQLKLQSQEEDFRLQNSTLIQELSNLVSQNEELEKQVINAQTTRVSEPKADVNSFQLDDEIRRLQAQNSALQKTVTALQCKLNVENDTDHVNDEKDEKNSEEKIANSTVIAESEVDRENHSKTINEMKLSLDTELEEKKILKLELSEKEDKYTKEIKILKNEVEKLNDKLKKKQESYLQIQTEKETLFKENSEKLQELQGIRDRDQKYYNDQINKHQQEIAKYQRSLQILNEQQFAQITEQQFAYFYSLLQDEMKSNADQTIKQLQNRITGMQQQINAADIIENQHLQEKSSKYEIHIKDLKEQILTLTQRSDDLSAQFEECQKASSVTADQLCSLQRDRDEQIQALQEANKLAEKRKMMLDDLAISYQKDCDKHREQILNMEESYETKLKMLESKLDTEKKKVQELERLKPVVEEQLNKLSSLEETKGWLERRLEDTEGSLDKTIDENEATVLQIKLDYDSELEALKCAHSTETENLKSTFQTQIQTLEAMEESHLKNTQTLEAEIKKLKQELKDGVNDRKVHEKKGKSVLKDLQKQLQAERRRAEKLQERLQEVLSSGTNNKSIEDLFRNPVINDTWREDQSSISSWSGGGSRTGTLASTSHSALSTSPLSSPQSPIAELPRLPKQEDSMLENESQELCNRIGKLQQDKWDLEEKVRHLETSTAAMANDLLEKSRVVEHYVMDSRTDRKPHVVPTDDKISLKKVLDLVNKGEDQGLREMNKKLQNMLEETLTKNMHLQKDMETLSQEIVRLSKLPHQAPSDTDLQMTDKHPMTNHNHSTENSNVP